MATASSELIPMPSPSVPIARREGDQFVIDDTWYSFFKRLEVVLRKVRTEIP